MKDLVFPIHQIPPFLIKKDDPFSQRSPSQYRKTFNYIPLYTGIRGV